MSYVTNAILSAHPDTAAKINEEIAKRDKRKQQFIGPLDDCWPNYGGTKVLERDLWVCAFNHFPPHLILEAIRAVFPRGDGDEWDAGWQLIVADQEHDFEVYGPGDYGEWRWETPQTEVPNGTRTPVPPPWQGEG